MKHNELVTPAIPVDFVQDLFANCGAECLMMRLNERNADPALDALYESIRWANDLKHEADCHDGKVTAVTNTIAVEKLLTGFGAMRDLGFLS